MRISANWLVLLVAAGGCTISGDYNGTSFRCDEENGCPAGFECRAGACAPESDDDSVPMDSSSPAWGGASDFFGSCEATWYHDGDDDGFGDPDDSIDSCEQPEGYVDNGDDCDDTTYLRHPNGEEVCDGLDNDCDVVTEESCPADCTPSVRDDSVYLFCSALVTWAAAKEVCAASGTQLVRIDSDDENTWLRTTATEIMGDTRLWIGGNDAAEENVWRWTDDAQFWQGAESGAPIGGLYSNWEPGEPNNNHGEQEEDCAEVLELAWNDRECDKLQPFVCKR